MRIFNLLTAGPLPYLEVDKLQRFLHREVAAGAEDALIAWESQPVYTAGRRTRAADVPDTDLPVLAMDRGGSVTYHGPGQLVIYPILQTAPPPDVVRFVRRTEEILITALQSYKVESCQIAGRSGVWIKTAGQEDKKLCAIGIKFATNTTMHGMALNVNTHLEDFHRIIPCGLADAGVISLEKLGVTAEISEVADLLLPALASGYQDFLADLSRRGTQLKEIEQSQWSQLWEKAQRSIDFPPQTGVLWEAKDA